MEPIRKMLGIERWLVTGGSWGTTPSLAYGQTHPEACLGFVLRGIFLGTQREIEWFLYGMGRFYPKAYDGFVEAMPQEERGDLLTAYEKRLFGDDAEARMHGARGWFRYTESCSLQQFDPETVETALQNEPVVYGTGRLDAFYFRNRMFLEEDQLIANVGRIAHLPVVIMQGGHDVIAAPESAYRLYRAWPGAVLHRPGRLPFAGRSRHSRETDAGHRRVQAGATFFCGQAAGLWPCVASDASLHRSHAGFPPGEASTAPGLPVAPLSCVELPN
jgi:proline iminopeptidase